MIAKKPAERYQSMTEVIAALEACLRGETVDAPSVSVKSSEDSKFSEFLAGLAHTSVTTLPAASAKSATAVPAVTAAAPSDAFGPTLSISHSEDATDPQTQASAASEPLSDRGRGAARNWWQDPRLQIAAAAVGALVLGIAFFPSSSRSPTKSDGTKPTAPTVAVERSADEKERAVLEWVLKAGGTAVVKVFGNDRPLDAKTGLPPEPFEVGRITLATVRGIKPDDLKRLADVRGQFFLDASPSMVEVEAARVLAGIPGVDMLVLASTDPVFTSDIGAALGEHPVSYLILTGRELRPGSLAALKRLPKLENLLLQSCFINSSTLVEVMQLPHLKHLNLEGSDVSDEHLAALSLPKLTNLAVFGTPVTVPGLAAFQRRHPRCNFDGVDPETLAQVRAAIAGDGSWIDLFNGQDLAGWKGDTGAFSVENGVIVAATRGTLITATEYSDFDAELEFRLAEKTPKGFGTDAGFGFRGPEANPEQQGLVVQLATDQGVGVKAEKGMRGALQGIVGPAADPFQPWPQWNKLRVQCLGPNITVEMNGVTVVQANADELRQSNPRRIGLTRQSGHLSLQSSKGHSEFRNLRVRDLAGRVPPPTSDGWIDLFNGRDLSGWTPKGPDGWRVENGAIVGETVAAQLGWLMSDQDFSDFELDLEYKLAVDSNSGVFLRAWPDGSGSGKDFVEVQLLDDTGPAFSAISPARKTGSIFNRADAKPPANAPAGQWHRLQIRLEKQHVQVTVNGVQVCDYDKIERKEPGRIGLQLYPTRVEFRNIRVRDLAVPPPSPNDHALQFDGAADAVVSTFEIDFKRPFTMEGYVRLDQLPVSKQALCLAMKGTGQVILRALLNGECNVVGTGGVYYAASPAPLNRRAHIAVVYDGAQFKLFIDGKSVSKVKQAASREGAANGGRQITTLIFGGEQFAGVIDEVRISEVARYQPDFTPAERFSPDQDTLALYHCDEGTGDVLKDASGNNRHGRIIGAKWVRVEPAP